ncbi:MAG: 4Fe-4S dicluster domain-containing protein [Anaerolineae bacterium]|nr:4Fe-4S dicluster domain-containing protein [Anaerolineae bacterium]
MELRTIERPSLAALVAERAATNVYACYQCKRCTSGCPLSPHFDLAPHQIVRAVQLGRRAEVLGSEGIWLCASCQACTARCPQQVDVARMIEVLRIMSREEGVAPAVPQVHLFSVAALRSIRAFGRLYELGFLGELYLRLLLARLLDLRQLVTEDLPLAFRLLGVGKLRLLPTVARLRRGRPGVVRAHPVRLPIGYYPGCALHGTALDYGMSTRLVAGELGLDLIEPEGWVCCGTSPAHTTDHRLATRLPLKNLALYQAMGLECVMMPCASCYLRSRTALYDIEREPELKGALSAETGFDPERSVRVEHLLETLEGRVGLQRIAARVRRPLEGLRVVCYYGCLLTRPPLVVQQPHPEYPRSMDRIVEALGAEPLDWSYKTECCGGSLGLSETGMALELVGRILRDARAVGAEAVVVACPLCHANLDMRQHQLKLEGGALPVLYVTELLGLAFGLGPAELGLTRHLTDTMALLRAKDLAAEDVTRVAVQAGAPGARG